MSNLIYNAIMSAIFCYLGMRLTSFDNLLSFSNWSAKTKDEKFGVIVTWSVLLASVTLLIVTGCMGKKKLNKFQY
jgi:hypothetical protein